MPQQPNVNNLQLFFGMINCFKKYSPFWAELGDRLGELTMKDAPSIWGPEHTKAFDANKKERDTKKLPALPYSNIMSPKNLSIYK